MGFSPELIQELEKAGFLVKDPHKSSDGKDCLDHAIDGIKEKFPDYDPDPYYQAIAEYKNSSKPQLKMLDKADEKAGISTLSLLLKDDSKMTKDSFSKVIMELMTDVEQNYDDQFHFLFRGSTPGKPGHAHSLDLKKLRNDQTQDYDPNTEFTSLDKFIESMSNYSKLELDIRSKSDLNNMEVFFKLYNLLKEITDGNESHILGLKNNYRAA